MAFLQRALPSLAVVRGIAAGAPALAAALAVGGGPINRCLRITSSIRIMNTSINIDNANKTNNTTNNNNDDNNNNHHNANDTTNRGPSRSPRT